MFIFVELFFSLKGKLYLFPSCNELNERFATPIREAANYVYLYCLLYNIMAQ